MKNQRYIVVCADTIKELMIKVNAKIDDGYLPSGSLAITFTSEAMDEWFYQLMILSEGTK